MTSQNNTVINIYTGSQYFIQDGNGTNVMVQPSELLSKLQSIANKDNFKKIVVTMYLRIEREVKIIGDTKWFEYITRDEPGARFVIEKYDAIYTAFRFNSDATVLISNKGQILYHHVLQNPPVDKMADQKMIDDFADTLKSMTIDIKEPPQKKRRMIDDIADITDTLKSMSIDDVKESLKKNKNIIDSTDIKKDIDTIEQLVNDMTKNMMDSTITTFIQDFLSSSEKNMGKETYQKVLSVLSSNGWENNGFNSPPNKQNIINGFCELVEELKSMSIKKDIDSMTLNDEEKEMIASKRLENINNKYPAQKPFDHSKRIDNSQRDEKDRDQYIKDLKD